ncbi:MAG: HEPN domain-containing protein [Spirochaetales bacterium]|nr:HEPN domain-containing protein [Spirochaetales bacterium]
MEEGKKEISAIRLTKARENLQVSEELLQKDHFSFSLNRSYYALFDAIRAVNALDGFDSSKHSGVIAHFNQYHVKNGDFDPGFSTIIKEASYMREKADYDDFFSADGDKAAEVLEKVRRFVDSVQSFLKDKNYTDDN